MIVVVIVDNNRELKILIIKKALPIKVVTANQFHERL